MHACNINLLHRQINRCRYICRLQYNPMYTSAPGMRNHKHKSPPHAHKFWETPDMIIIELRRVSPSYNYWSKTTIDGEGGGGLSLYNRAIGSYKRVVQLGIFFFLKVCLGTGGIGSQISDWSCRRFGIMIRYMIYTAFWDQAVAIHIPLKGGQLIDCGSNGLLGRERIVGGFLNVGVQMRR